MSRFFKPLSLILLALVSGAAYAEIGTVQFTIGDVRLQTARGVVQAVKGTQINEGDTILVGSGTAHLKMVDGGIVAVRPDTQMKFDQYKWNGREDGSERGLLSLVKGGFRTITGAIGRLNKDNLKINTPTATVGIRGTDHEVVFIPAGTVSFAPMPLVLAGSTFLQSDGEPLLVGQIDTLGPMLLAQVPGGGGFGGGGGQLTGTFNKVNTGQTITTSNLTGQSLPGFPNTVVVVTLNGVVARIPVAVYNTIAPATRPPGQGFTAGTGTGTGQGQGQGQQGQGQQGQGQQGQGQQGQGQQGQQQAQGQTQGQGQQGQGQQGQSQQGQQQAQSGQTGATGGAGGSTTETTIRTVTVVDSSSSMNAGVNTAVTTTNAVNTTTNPTVTVTPGTTGAGTTGSSSTGGNNATVTPIVLTSSTGTTLNLTQSTLTSSSGSTVSVSQGAYGIQAETAANAAQAAANSLQALVTAAGSAATQTLPSAISVAQPDVTSAQSAFSPVPSLTINSALATSNANSISTLATSAQTTGTAATAARTANGVYADPTSSTALSTMNTALTNISTAAATVATSATTVGNKATDLGTFKTEGGTTLSTVGSLMTSANSGLSTLTSLGKSTTTTAQIELGIAQTAAAQASAASLAAKTYQEAGDFTLASNQATYAQQWQTIATNALSAATTVISGIAAAGAAKTLAGVSSDTSTQETVYGYANSAQIAKSAGDTALVQTDAAVTSPSPSAANVVTTNVTTVTGQAPIVRYSNPANTSVAVGTARWNFNLLSTNGVVGGVEVIEADAKARGSNQAYVLDGDKRLLEVRNGGQMTSVGATGPGPNATVKASGTNYVNSAFQGPSVMDSADVQVKFIGGTPGSEGNFIAPDKTVYMGRWVGGSLDFMGGNLASPQSVAMGSRSSHWVVTMDPAATGNMRSSSALSSTPNQQILAAQNLIGTTSFNKVYNTTPTDDAGNTGSVTSAALSVNFSRQTVDASVGVSFTGARNMNLTANATNAALDGNGFKWNSGPLTGGAAGGCATTGANGCDSSGYTAFVSGGLTGAATISGAGFSYTFFSMTPPASPTPFADTVQGLVAFATSGTPTAGSVLNFADNTKLRHRIFYPILETSGGTTRAFATSVSNVNFDTNTNFLYDAAGNLVRVQDTLYTAFDKSTPYSGASLAVPAPPNNSSGNPVMMSFSGGTAAELYADATTGLRFGRWSGGTVTVSDLTTGQSYFDQLGPRSALWLTSQNQAVWPVAGLTGVWQYNRFLDGSSNPTFATAATDAYGNVGTLDAARLSVDFTNMKFSAGVTVTMAQSGIGGANGLTRFGGYVENAAISGTGTFNVSSGDTNPFRVGCSGPGCISTSATMLGYGGRITGGFSGLNAQGAFYRYTFNPNFTTDPAALAANHYRDDLVSGLVGFTKGSQITTPSVTAVPRNTMVAYAYNNPNVFTQTNNYQTMQAANIDFDGSGNLVEVKQDDGGTIDQELKVDSGGTPVNTTAGQFATTGIAFGRYSNSPALSLRGDDFSGSFTGRGTLGSGLAWITVPMPSPFYLSSIITGSLNYTADGSLFHDQTGAAATGVSASLSANFTNQTVNFALGATTTGGTWSVTTPSPVRMDDSGSFFAQSGGFSGTVNGAASSDVSADTHRKMSVLFTPNAGSPQAAFGSANGQLSGPDLNGAGMSYSLGYNNSDLLTGVVAFKSSGAVASSSTSGTAALESYRLILTSTGMRPSGNQVEEMNYRVGAALTDPQRTSFTGGVLSQWDVNFPTVVGTNCAPGCSTFNINSMPAVLNASSLTAVNTGSDAFTGLAWGRYEGAVTFTDRVTGSPMPGAGTVTYGSGNSTSALHFINTNVGGSPVVLPTTGTASYTMVGGTLPTNQAGVAGASLPTISLGVDFAQQKITTLSVAASAGGVNWLATKNASQDILIQQGTYFEASKNLQGNGNLDITRNGVATNTAGKVVGAFVGGTGRGVAMSYSMFQNPQGTNISNLTGATGISGVAALKR
jgi:hypothetical protein